MGGCPVLNPLRRPIKLRRPAVFADARFSEKQQTRENVAAAIAQYFGDMPEPYVFVMPAYDSFCAKTIDQRVPNAVFYATDYWWTVREHNAAVNVSGKT